MTVSELIAVLAFAPRWAEVQIYTLGSDTPQPIERAYGTPRGAVMLVVEPPAEQAGNELEGQMRLF